MRSFWCTAILAATLALSLAAKNMDFPDPPADAAAEPGTKSTAVLAGGCFWGVAGVFERVKGVSDVVSGFAGGQSSTAHYETVSTGTTGHAESVKITYNPTQISYGTLLKVFFAVAHDPTEKDRQGPDYGTQYRSAIFYTSDYQKHVAEAYIAELDNAHVFRHPIATQVVPLKGFYAAEAYHQHFLDRNPTYPYIVVNDLPKIEELKKQFPGLCARK